MSHYCVIYRTGGTVNFQWNRSVPMSREEAERTQQNVTRMGYKALVQNYKRSVAIGLPESYE